MGTKISLNILLTSFIYIERGTEIMELWIRVLIYALVLIVTYIFVKLTNLRFFGRVLSLKWRLLIAGLFPVILILGLVFGALIFSLVLVVLLIFYLFSRKRKFTIRF